MISGSFNTDETKELIEKYFGTISSQPKPASIDVSEPAEIGMKFQKYEDKLAPLPAFLLGWKIPPRSSSEFNALYLAGKVLYDGESSRLYQKLVKGAESALQLFGFTDERRGPSAIYIGAIPKEESLLEEIRQTITAEIKTLPRMV